MCPTIYELIRRCSWNKATMCELIRRCELDIRYFMTMYKIEVLLFLQIECVVAPRSPQGLVADLVLDRLQSSVMDAVIQTMSKQHDAWHLASLYKLSWP